jgi:dCMP deaminase
MSDANRQRKWDRRYLRLAVDISEWSKDPSTQVGAVLVRENRIVATGFNGFPEGHNDDPRLYADRSYKYKYIIHAEVNAFKTFEETLQNVGHYTSLTCFGFTLYSSFPVCPSCMKEAAKRGVHRVISRPLPTLGKSPEWIREWEALAEKARKIAESNGMYVEWLEGLYAP